MHNTCVSSSFSVRYKGSPSFSLNDYSCCLSDRFDRHPLLNSESLSSQCCACCCSNSLYAKAPILKPSCFYGLRQSTLIQWSPYKRLILNGLDQCYSSRFSVSGVDRSCSCESYGFKERNVCGRRGKLGRGRYRCMIFEEECERHNLCGGGCGGSFADEAEVVLSLLTEDVSDECFDLRERREKLFRKIDVEKGGKRGGNNVRSRKKSVESGVLENISKFEYEAKIIRSSDENRTKEDTRRENDKETVSRSNRGGRAKKEERSNWLGENSNEIVRQEEREILLRENQRGRLSKEEKESLSRREDHRRKVRKDGSSCSSYYSLSSGEFDHEDDIQAQEEGFKGELYSGYRKDSKRSQDIVSDETKEDFERQDNSMEYGVVLSKESNQAGFSGASSVVKSDWRKKSEKKLTDISVDSTQCRKDSAQNLSMYRGDKDSSYRKGSGSYSRSDDRNEISMNIDERTREQCRQRSETGIGMKYKQFTETSDTYGADLETSSASHKLYGSREETSTKSSRSVQDAKEHHLTAEQIRREEECRGSSVKFADASKVQKVDSRGTSTAEIGSESRMKGLEDHATRIQSSVHDTKEQHHQAVHASRLADSRIKTEKLTTDMNKESTSVSQRESENRMIKHEVKSSSVYNSHLEIRQREMNSKHVSTAESTKGSQEVSNISLSYKSDTGVSSVDDRERRKVEVVMAPSPSQLAATGSLHASGLRIEEIANERLQSGSSAASGLRIEEIVDEKLHDRSTALHEHTLDKSQVLHETDRGDSRGHPVKLFYPEDALGSADRLQKSSARYVGEFVQQVKDEVSSSEIQKVKDTYKAKLLSQEKQHTQESLSSYGSEVSELKEQDSRRPSQGSGIKGPSDEMWDVTEPTIQKPPEAEAVVAESTAENAIVKRGGKSLWNIIGDIVRLRWSSHSEHHSSPSKSRGKSSPNQSTSSETWFSGHEQEENNDLNVQNNRISLTQGALSIEQQQEEKISSSQVDVSRSSNSKSETKHIREGASTSSVIVQKDSSLQATSLPSNEASSKTEYKATVAVTEGAELSPQMSSLQVERILATAETKGSGTGAIIKVDQPVPTVLSNKSSPERRNEELKRRKLQRIDQVQKDRFDEWEEAYRFETEQRKIDEMFMREALLEAKKAADIWEVPVGAVLVRDGKIIARGYNLVEELRDSTAHAEMICIREASNILRTWRLSETTLYITLEPCPMCAGAILQARIDTVVWGAPNKLLGADGSWIRLFPNGDGGSGLESSDKPAAPVHPFHPKIVIRRGILSSQCADMMQQFFQLRRKKKEKKSQEPTTPPSCLPVSHHPSKFLTKMHDAFHLMFCL